jgi:hypothetical protein
MTDGRSRLADAHGRRVGHHVARQWSSEAVVIKGCPDHFHGRLLKNSDFGSLRAADGCAAIFNGLQPLKMWATRESHVPSGIAEKGHDGLFQEPVRENV